MATIFCKQTPCLNRLKCFNCRKSLRNTMEENNKKNNYKQIIKKILSIKRINTFV